MANINDLIGSGSGGAASRFLPVTITAGSALTQGSQVFFNSSNGQIENAQPVSTLDLSNASLGGQSADLPLTGPSAQLWRSSGLVTRDGLKAYILADGGSNNDYQLQEYTMSTANNLGTLSFTNAYDVSVNDTAVICRGLYISDDGTKMFIGVQNDSPTTYLIYEYTLSTPFDSSTMTFVTSLDVTSVIGNRPQAIEFSNDGTKMILAATDDGTVYEYNLSTGFSLATATAGNSQELQGSTVADRVIGLYLTDDGLTLIAALNGGIRKYALSSANDITTRGTSLETFVGASKLAGIVSSETSGYTITNGTGSKDRFQAINMSITDPNSFAIGAASQDIAQGSTGKILINSAGEIDYPGAQLGDSLFASASAVISTQGSWLNPLSTAAAGLTLGVSGSFNNRIGVCFKADKIQTLNIAPATNLG